jgi:hypothetical protein
MTFQRVSGGAWNPLFHIEREVPLNIELLPCAIERSQLPNADTEANVFEHDKNESHSRQISAIDTLPALKRRALTAAFDKVE